ncbi:MAG TPA: methyltransferase [Terriglobales bacterium]|nr:methyltransferase [Terriglobales bacterium]
MSSSLTELRHEQDPAITPIPLMQLSTAFWAFKTLSTAVDMDLFTRLSATPMSASELAHWYRIEERPAEMLLTGCAGLGLLAKKDGRYHNAPLAEKFLIRGGHYYFGGFVTMLNRRLYPGWDKLPEAVTTNRPTTWDPDKQKSLFEGSDPAMMQTFWQAMHSLSLFTARALGEAVDFSGFRKLLDVGGGSGAYDIELCQRYPNLAATVYDLPFVAEIASERIAEAGLQDRITTQEGDFFADPTYPTGHDVILLSMIMHDWSEEEDRAILRKCYDALPPGGAVIISELLVNDDKTGPASAALMSLNMLVETVGGRNYTAAELSAWLKDIGYQDIRVVSFEAPGANGAVIGHKPKR